MEKCVLKMQFSGFKIQYQLWNSNEVQILNCSNFINFIVTAAASLLILHHLMLFETTTQSSSQTPNADGLTYGADVLGGISVKVQEVKLSADFKW